MQTYTCPTCGEKMERDLSIFMEHTDRHIVDELKKKNPAWITPDGFCAKCLEHYKMARQGVDTANLDSAGVWQRVVVGGVGFGAAALAWFWIGSAQAPRMARLVLFPLFFLGLLGFLQARKKLCVVIAQRQSEAMRRQASKILILSAILSALLTVAAFLYSN